MENALSYPLYLAIFNSALKVRIHYMPEKGERKRSHSESN